MAVTGMREITPVTGSHLVVVTRVVGAEGPLNISKIPGQLIDQILAECTLYVGTICIRVNPHPDIIMVPDQVSSRHRSEQRGGWGVGPTPPPPEGFP